MPTLRFSRLHRVLLAAAGTLCLAGGAALAQPYDGDGSYGPNAYGPSEEMTVTAPAWYHHGPQRSEIGAPIEDVALSEPVSFADLDLSTRWGAHKLRERIRAKAHALCNRLDIRYPISTSDSPPCYRAAVEDAMTQANAAIRQARYERYGSRRDYYRHTGYAPDYNDND